MSLTIKPLIEKSYTKDGNEYYKSNRGKFAAKAIVAAGAGVLAGDLIYNSAKKIKLPKKEAIKTFINDVQDAAMLLKSKINMPDFKLYANELKGVVKKLKVNTNKFGKAIKNTVNKTISIAKKHPATTGKILGFAAASAIILAAGAGIDAIINRKNAKEADKI